MYCPQCSCEYTGWKHKCPVCQTRLLEVKPNATHMKPSPIDYDSLVEAVRNYGGSITIEMETTDVESKRGRRMPYIGRGYAWAKQMEGSNANFSVKLQTSEVGRDRKWAFPYYGYGYAWEKSIQGSVNGNALTLTAEKVARERKVGFPYKGYGYAWVQSMSGDCGEKLKATLTISEVRKHKQWTFPYFGFGFAWVNAGKLTLTLA